MSDPRVHGVLVTYRRPDDLSGSLAMLAAQTRRLDHLVVVDNDVDSDLTDVIATNEHAATTITLVDAPDNLGPAGGIALGMTTALSAAGPDDLLLVLDDDDPLPDDGVVGDVVGAMIDRRAQDPAIGGIGLRGSVIDAASGRLTKPAVRDGASRVAYLKSNWAPVYRVDIARRIGVFREDLFFGFDDLEYGLRLNDAGYAVEVHELGRPDTTEQFTPTRGFRRTPWRTYYTLRNLVVMLWGYGHRRAAVRMAAMLGFGKPMVNLIAGPDRSVTQAWMSLLAVWDAVRGRMGRSVEPDASKFSEPRS